VLVLVLVLVAVGSTVVESLVPDCDMLPAVGSSVTLVGSTVVGLPVGSPVELPEPVLLLLVPAVAEVPPSSPQAARRTARPRRGRRDEARLCKSIRAG